MFQYQEDNESEASYAEESKKKEAKEQSLTRSGRRFNVRLKENLLKGLKGIQRRPKAKQKRGTSLADRKNNLSSAKSTARISKYQLQKQKRPPVRNARVDRKDRLASRRAHQADEDNEISVNTKGPISKKRWTPEEDARLVGLVKKHGEKWPSIAKVFKVKSAIQCRERWCNHLDPNINKSPWTKEEDLLLIKLQKEKGNSWAEISKCMNGRTENNIKNRFNGASIKRLLLTDTKRHVDLKSTTNMCTKQGKSSSATETNRKSENDIKNKFTSIKHKLLAGADSKGTNASTKQGRSSRTADRNLIEEKSTQSLESNDSNDLNNITKGSKRRLTGIDDNNVKSTKKKRAKNISSEENVQLKGFTRKIVVPEALQSPMSVDFIKNYNVDITFENLIYSNENKLKDTKMWEFMFSILKGFKYPHAPVELRSQTIWTSRTMRYLNYFSALILLIKYQNHEELPEELSCDGIPPWWYVVRFFNHFKLTRNHKSRYDNPHDDNFSKEINVAYDVLNVYFIIETNIWMFTGNFIFKAADGYLDCSLDTNSERLFGDLQRFLNSYNRQYNVGAYDEAWFNKDTKKCTDEDRHDELKQIAKRGLHHFEIALMETVFQAKPLIQDKRYKQFAALKIDSIDCGPTQDSVNIEFQKKMEKEIKNRDTIIDTQNIEIERLKLHNKKLQEMQALSKDLKEDLQCPICFNPMNDPCIVPECCHRFCYKCIEDAIAKCGKECPICRARITSKRDFRRDELFGRIAEVVCDQEDKEDVGKKNLM
ncbi:transcription factor MYB98-like [Chaetoceros tenuissimus]|uniref:Transcription factor MYB98-like n=1 Tax=Chaetoceros tenuissimus TaxID=426638 RepID=A0AAD3D0T3_9STRA|nr:transcription factor MYB98-like [Chaetoceros tenuissimus]